MSGLLVLQLASIAVLCGYGAHRLWMLARFRWRPRVAPVLHAHPRVTVQLPLYEERAVAARLLRAVGALRWPRERLEIQVLDDSRDETRLIVERELERLRARGLDARVLRRDERVGYKAGALAHGLQVAKGELLCVFDADFVPEPDFLERLVGHFADPRVGLVQARWGHLERDATPLSRAQATLLDGHFVVEHTVRHARGLFFNFNGTAGIWRRAAIEEAGGWQHDTLTEDLDLSYRAQLAGWRFVYAPEVVVPAELPGDVASFLTQQHRWAKGSVQVLRKLAPRLIRARLPWRIKLEALMHLGANVGHPALLLVALLLPLTPWIAPPSSPWAGLVLFVLGTASALLFYERGPRALGRPARRRLPDLALALALGVGASLSQTIAVLEGLGRETGSFARTPKRGARGGEASYRARLLRAPGAELVLAAWLAFGAVAVARAGGWPVLPFFALFVAGFAWVGVARLAEAMRRRAKRPPRRAGDVAAPAVGYWRSNVPVR